ncbi:gluconeogenesis factor YvcK family protein [Brachybacterium alimentarium]|uniref:gluconeogenesis factor YvcK family protein n=1 Tax=Brachybacterium alimentarium TaxID=47845 RepID=UPI000DF40715|nr:gluconeogenesis factor YvcK family protein [Brachybacterium alimentarium]RCS68471.1 uridine diphosphate-N-acetylglucosamine-binding protein YvcK [Brachybacterium alimentarium]RCS78798.1 uridine diphosphate-N-acetylglucosamine-binding protein YvcK [Brachybacterium alimentarium]
MNSIAPRAGGHRIRGADRSGNARRGRRGDPQRPLRVVALGGGHGLAANLRALRLLADDITAVVTVADNGGSSGRIRTEMPVLPPGDLRMALAALCEDSDWGTIWEDVIQHRFETDGELGGHALGNLLIVSLWQILDDPIEGLDQMAELLGARGRVLPMALDPLDIEADVRGADGELRLVSGQWQVATAEGRVEQVRLVPPRPRVPEDVLEAIARADWIFVGPGSWYTSVLPHLMIPEIAEAIRTSPARRCITTNLSVGAQEAEGMTSLDMLDVLLEHADGCRFDALVADPTTLDDALELAQAAKARGIRALLRQVSVGDGRPHHDPVRLAAAYRDLFDDAYGDVEPEQDGWGSPAPPLTDRASIADAASNEEDLHGTDG